MKPKVIDLLTPSQEAICNFMGKSTRWLTHYELSMLTGVSLNRTKAAVAYLRRLGLVIARTRLYGFDNGENEFKGAPGIGSARKERLSDYRLYGVEPLSKKLQRIMGVEKAREAERFLK